MPGPSPRASTVASSRLQKAILPSRLPPGRLAGRSSQYPLRSPRPQVSRQTGPPHAARSPADRRATSSVRGRGCRRDFPPPTKLTTLQGRSTADRLSFRQEITADGGLSPTMLDLGTPLPRPGRGDGGLRFSSSTLDRQTSHAVLAAMVPAAALVSDRVAASSFRHAVEMATLATLPAASAQGAAK